MAGDWIKLEHATLDKPEVARFSDLLGISHGDGLELLLRFWVWADDNIDPQHCPDFVPIMSPKYLDKMLHCPGFASALAAVGWLKISNDQASFSLPNFGSHNGQTAKTRAYEQKKKARQRQPRPENVPQIPGPEKRREEVVHPPASDSTNPRQSVDVPPKAANNGKSHPKATRLAENWQLPEEWKDWAVKVYHLEPQRAVRISLAFRDYWLSASRNATKVDWAATWRNWVRREVEGHA